MIRPGETVEERYTVPDIGASSMTVDVRLLFRSFPPYFLTELEESADLDPDVATRMPLVNIAETHLELSAALEEIE
jgi:acyl-CoA hydrolase